MAKDLTKAQKRAVAALFLLCEGSRAAGWHRWHIGQAAKRDCSSYPMKTMRALQRRGLVRPLSDEAVEMVESGLCRCGCDLWTITPEGREYALSLKVVGSVRVPGLGLSSEQIRRLFGEHESDEWWKRGDGPPDYDPNSPSQRDIMKQDGSELKLTR